MYIIQDEKVNGIMQFIMGSEALNFGYSLFETIRVKDGTVQLLSRHMDRLYSSCKFLDIALPPVEELESKINEFVKEKSGDYALKVLAGKMYDMPLICISTREITYTRDDYEKGFKVCIADTIRDSNNSLNKVKNANYMGNFLAKKQALEKGFNEPVFLNQHGNITEGATTNIFLRINNEIVTPKIEDGILPGIMRGYIISQNPNIIERSIHVDELENAEGAWLTNSLLGSIKVSCIGDKVLENNDFKLI